MKVKHKKTGNIYKIVRAVTNATNNRDGEIMIEYTNGKEFFVREAREFFSKFEVIGED